MPAGVDTVYIIQVVLIVTHRPRSQKSAIGVTVSIPGLADVRKKSRSVDRIETPRQLGEQVYASIRDAICSGTFEPGARMAEDALARRINVSRQPVHQALQQLHREGFLTETGRRGLVVAPLNIELAVHVYDLRAALDAQAAMRAAEHADAVDRAEAADLLHEGRRAIAEHDIAGMVQADFRFHGYVYHLSGNPLIEAIATNNWHHVRRVVTALSTRLMTLAPSWQEHENILNAIASGDPVAAGALARGHVERTIRVLRSFGDDPFHNKPRDA